MFIALEKLYVGDEVGVAVRKISGPMSAIKGVVVRRTPTRVHVEIRNSHGEADTKIFVMSNRELGSASDDWYRGAMLIPIEELEAMKDRRRKWVLNRERIGNRIDLLSKMSDAARKEDNELFATLLAELNKQENA